MFDVLGRVRRPPTRTLAIVMVITLAAGCSTRESTVAEGSSSSTASETASATAPTSLNANHILDADLERYALVDLPKSLERQARRQFAAAAGLDDDEAKLDVSSLTDGGVGIGVVLVVTLSPEYAALPGTEEGFARGMAQSAEVPPDEIDLGAGDGYLIDTPEQAIVAWQDANLLVAVITEQRTIAIDAARKIVQAAG